MDCATQQAPNNTFTTSQHQEQSTVLVKMYIVMPHEGIRDVAAIIR